MKNNLLLKVLFSNIDISLEKINFITPAKLKNKLMQLPALKITVLAGFTGILIFSNYLVYTLQPSVWHWGFDSTITWENHSINWENIISIICSVTLILGGLTLFQLTYNFNKQLKKYNKQLRPCLLSSEKPISETLKVF